MDSAVSQAIETVMVDEFELSPDDLKPDAHLIDDLGLDSLDVVDLFVALEQHFDGRRVPEDEARKARNLGDVAALISAHLLAG